MPPCLPTRYQTTGQPLCIPPKPPNQKLLCLLANRLMIVPMLLVCEDDTCAETELDGPALESWVVIRTVAARRWLWVASAGATARRRSSKCCHPVRNRGQRSPAACRRQSPGPGSHRNSGYQSQIGPDMRGSWLGTVSRLIYASAAAYQGTPGTPSEVASDLPSYGRLSRTLIPGRLAVMCQGLISICPWNDNG